MSGIRILCSTGTVTHRALLHDHRRLLELVPRLDAEAFEFIVYPIWYAFLDEVVDGLLATGRSFPITHSEKMIGAQFASGDPSEAEDGFRRLENCCSAARRIGSERVVLHLWEMPVSDDRIENNFAAADRCLEIAARHGQILSVETIPCRRADPLTHLVRLAKAHPSMAFTLDTQHLGFHGQDDALHGEALRVLWERPEAAPLHFHIRDYEGEPFDPATFSRSLHPGEGRIDLARLFAAMRDDPRAHDATLEASGVTLSPDGEVCVDTGKINRSLEYLRGL